MTRCRFRRVRLAIQGLDAHPLHAGGNVQPSCGEAFLAQKPLHHSAARKRILHVQFIDPAHQFEVIRAGGARLVVEATPADPEQIGLARKAKLVTAIRHFFALAGCIKRDRPAAADKWHLDEVVVPINGVKMWLWRAVDGSGDVLDILVQPRRNAKAARRFLRQLIARFGKPRVIITDKLRSYIKPIRQLAPDADHHAHKGLNNRIEGSYRPTRKREKVMGRFKSPRQAQRFLTAHDQINTVFRPRRYQLSAISYRHARADAFGLWKDYAAEMTA